MAKKIKKDISEVKNANIIPPSDKKSSKTDKDEIKEVKVNDLIKPIIDSLKDDPPENAAQTRNILMRQYLYQKINSSPVSEQYNVLILYDEGRMVQNDADHIYSAANNFMEKKPILLVLYSTGGVIGSAYLISKLCREYSNGKFIVVVPRQAKSAATLICCGADEIHMGSLSELGPIDPQINDYPALGLKNSVEHIADLIQQYPKASDMFAKYLHLSLEPINLGYYERVAQSAVQYAERLLKKNKSELKKSASKIAYDLVYSYKDHGFVIDAMEAKDIFGENVVKMNTNEYLLGNMIYEAMIFFSRVADIMNYYFYFIGACSSEPNFRKRNTK